MEEKRERESSLSWHEQALHFIELDIVETKFVIPLGMV